MDLVYSMACLSDLGEVLCSCSEELTIFSAFFLIIDRKEQITAVTEEINLHCMRCIMRAGCQAAYIKNVE